MNAQNNTVVTPVVGTKGFSIKGLVDSTKAKAKELYQAPVVKVDTIQTPELLSAEEDLKKLTKARQDAIDGVNLAFNARIEAKRQEIADIKKAIQPAVAQQKIVKAMDALGSSLEQLSK